MSNNAANTVATIIPTIRYRDAPAALDWLVRAFGFEQHLVVEEEGLVAHAQLVFGNGMIMIGSERDHDFDSLQKPLADPAGSVSQSPYIIIDNVDAHYEQAAAAGATIITEPEDQPYGGRLYSCRDPEGNLWNFGSYDPWQKDQ